MSGHSKWSSIKHQKGAADAKRGKVFTKLGAAVTIAARLGGGDAATNPRLALAIDMAKKNNMPKDNIDRAIKRGTGELGGAAAEEITYEGYAPGGTAVLIQTLTDNRNRTIGEVRAVFNKYGGKLGEAGSVAYLFNNKGLITITSDGKSTDELELAIIDSGAEDYEITDEGYTIYTDPKSLESTRQSLESAGLNITNAEISYVPSQTITISDEKTANQIIRIITALEELDDISEVISNFDIDESIADQIQS